MAQALRPLAKRRGAPSTAIATRPRGVAKVDSSVPGPSPEWVNFFGIPWDGDETVRGADTYARTMTRVVWIWRCADLIATSALQAPLKLYRGGRSKPREVTDHPILELLDDVNSTPDMDGTDLVREQLVDMVLGGESFLQVVANRAGLPAELYWQSNDDVEPIPDRKTFVRGFRSRHNPELTWGVDEMLWWKRFNRFNRWKGLSAIAALKQSINIDVNAQTSQKAVFANGGLASGAIAPTTDLPLPPGETKKIAEEWRERMGGAQNAHAFGFLSYPVQFLKLGLTAQDVAWMDTRKVSRIEICGALGVPLILAGDDERSTYDNYVSARRSFWQDTETAWLRWREGFLNKALVRRFDPEKRLGLFLEYDLTAIPALQRSPDEQWKWEKEAIASGRTYINEVRQQYGEEPVPWGDSWWGPGMTVELANLEGAVEIAPAPAPAAAAPPEGAPAPVENTPAGDTTVPAPTDDTTAAPKGRKAWAPTKRTPQYREALKRRHGAVIDVTARHFARDVDKALTAQLEAILAKLPAKSAKLAGADVYVSALPALKAAAKKAFIRAGTEAYASATEQLGGKSAEKAPDDGEDPLLTVTFDLGNPRVAALVRDLLGKRIVAIDELTRTDVDAMIREGIRRGYSIPQIANGLPSEEYRGIRGLYEETYNGRSTTIARTETSWSFSRTSMTAYEDAGIAQHEWMLGLGDSQELCQALDGEVVNVGEPFSDGSIAPPDPHPNCTCSLLPVVV